MVLNNIKKHLLFIPFFLLLSFQNFKPEPAVEFLESLNTKQIAKIQLNFEDQTRQQWHFFPASMWSREGIKLGDLTVAQYNLFLKLLRSSLSETGYDKTLGIIELEKVLAGNSGSTFMRDAEKYYVAFYGDPRKDKLWGWSFEGHHISLNFTKVNDKIFIVPRFFGANPATITSGKRKGERTLHKEEDLGLKLINSLSLTQKKIAIFDKKSFDIVTSNDSYVKPLKMAGVSLNNLNQDQQTILLELIEEYLLAMPLELATKRMTALKTEEFNQIRFAWSGNTEMGKPHYYRIQGETFLVEFDNTQDNGNHIHTVWRDFDGDFGRDLIKEHYQTSSHHK